MHEPMEAAILHAKFLAKHLNRCSSQYIVRIALKETSLPSSHDGFQFALHTVNMLQENPFGKLKHGIYLAVGLLRDPPAGQDAVEQCIRSCIRTGWMTRNVQLWEYYFPEGCPGNKECPSNRDYLMGIVDFIELWKCCCEEVRYESV